MIKICTICGNLFETKTCTKYCSTDCRHTAQKIQNHLKWKRRYAKNRIQILARHKLYRQAHHEQLLLASRQYDAAHREQRKLKAKAYRAKNHDAIRARERAADKLRYKLNPTTKKLSVLRHYLKFKDKINSRRYILRKLWKEEHKLPFCPFCHTCGKAFKPSYNGEKYCSDKCRAKSPLSRLWLRIQSRLGY